MSGVRANCRSMWSRENRGGDKSTDRERRGGSVAPMWETGTEAERQRGGGNGRIRGQDVSHGGAAEPG